MFRSLLTRPSVCFKATSARAAFAALGMTLTLAMPVLAQELSPDVPAPATLDEVIEAWQDASRPEPLTLPEFLDEHHPDLLASWTDQAAGALGGSLLAVYEDSQPDWLGSYRDEYLEMDADGFAQGDDASFVDYLIHYRPKWFTALEIDIASHDGQNLELFVEDREPQVLEELTGLNTSLDANPIGLLEFTTTYVEDPQIQGQVHTYVQDIIDYNTTAGTASTCTCRVDVAGVEEPAFQVDEHNPNIEVRRNNGTWKEYRHGYLTQRGAAQRLGTVRFIRNGLTELYMTNKAASATISFKMRCNRVVGNDVLQCAQGAGCSAAVKVKSKYNVYFKVKNDASGVPAQSKASTAMALNTGVLKQNPDSSNEVVLFEKGLALQRSYNTQVSVSSVMNGIKSGYNLYQNIDSATSGSGNFGTLLNDIDDEDVKNVLAIATYDGSRGTSYANLQAGYSNAGAAPVVINPGEEVVFELTSINTARTRGWGGTSTGETLTAGSYYLVGVADDFSCNAASPPDVSAAWAYNAVYQAPFGVNNMRASVEGFILGQTGQSMTATGTAGSWHD